jgi:hypothetical protein
MTASQRSDARIVRRFSREQTARHNLPDLHHGARGFALQPVRLHPSEAATMRTDLTVWLDHFEYHSQHRAALPRGKADELTPYEHRLIAGSIATFQLGEQSEGSSLLRATGRYEQTHDASPVARLISLFIAEEQHHAALLGAFMDQHGIARKRRDWTDAVFRHVRRLAGFKLHLSVLISAELIGIVYYRALEAATGCRQLRTLCHLLVADELAHVGFESDLLLTAQEQKRPLARGAWQLAHKAFFTGAALVVWLTHGRVLRAAGYRLPTYLRACTAQFSFYLESPDALERATADH